MTDQEIAAIAENFSNEFGLEDKEAIPFARAVLDADAEARAASPLTRGWRRAGEYLAEKYAEDPGREDRVKALRESVRQRLCQSVLQDASPVPEVCGNCDTALPEGCGGLFKDDGEHCRLNATSKPTHKLNTDRTVAVATDYFWNEDMRTCPLGAKVQLLGEGGVASYGNYNGRDPFWVAWAPLPKRRTA